MDIPPTPEKIKYKPCLITSVEKIPNSKFITIKFIGWNNRDKEYDDSLILRMSLDKDEAANSLDLLISKPSRVGLKLTIGENDPIEIFTDDLAPGSIFSFKRTIEELKYALDILD